MYNDDSIVAWVSIALFCGAVVVVLILASLDKAESQSEQPPQEPPQTKAPEVEHHPIYKALGVLLDAEPNDVSAQVMKYIRNKIVAGCDEIQNSSKNQMLCGVRIKEYIGTSRTMFQENKALLSLSGMSEEAFAKLVDGVCVDIYAQYFGE